MDGTLKEKITSDDIRQFMDSTRAGQSLLIAASSYTGMMKSETVVQAAKAAPPRSILVLTASGPNDHSYFVSGWDKLLTPVQHALESDQPPFDGPFDAEALWTAVQAEAKVDIQTRPDTPTEASGPIQFGPLAGSQHTPGARFYFPDPRQAASSPDPAVTKPDAAQDDPAPTVPPVDTKAAE